MSVFADLPAGVWRAGGLAVPTESVLPTGLPALDELLPGGGWPLGALIELLQPQPHALIWSLLSPALAQALADGPGALVLVSPPQTPFIPSLAAQGLPASRWLRVEADGPGARLWATEQALRCAEVVAVLAWLPQVSSADLRRLQLAAQRHRQLLFVMRPLSAAAQASPARLRLALGELSPAEPSGGAGQTAEPITTWPALRVRVFKRRGAPAPSPVWLPAQPPLLARLLRARRSNPPAPLHSAPSARPAHGLDRAAARA